MAIDLVIVDLQICTLTATPPVYIAREHFKCLFSKEESTTNSCNLVNVKKLLNLNLQIRKTNAYSRALNNIIIKINRKIESEIDNHLLFTEKNLKCQRKERSQGIYSTEN